MEKILNHLSLLMKLLVMMARSKDSMIMGKRKYSSQMESNERYGQMGTLWCTLLTLILSKLSQIRRSSIISMRRRQLKPLSPMGFKSSNFRTTRLKSISVMVQRKYLSLMAQSSAFSQMVKKNQSSLMEPFRKSKKLVFVSLSSQVDKG